MTGIFDSAGLKITQFVNVVPSIDAVKVENRTLDGKFHVQTIGSHATLLEVVLFAETEAVRAAIDTVCGTCELVRIIVENASWYGIIRENTLAWEKKAGTFKTSFTLLVSSQGTYVAESE